MNRFKKLIVVITFIFAIVFAVGCKKDPNNGNDSDNPATTYIVTFDSNGGSGDMQPQVFTAGRQMILMANAFTRENYRFVNWNTAADGSGKTYSDMQKIIVSENITLFAQWERMTYTVQFVSNGGEGNMQPQIFIAGEMQVLSANTFTWENHVFIGWNTEWDGSGTAYSDTQEITLEENIVLWAQWIEATGQHGGHYYIDLGLPSGTKWATCNLGTDTPEGYGDYYAWGETLTKVDSSIWWNYYTIGNYTYFSNPTTLPANADAATVNWGIGWRMPTREELDELRIECTVIRKNNGNLFIGPNGCSIFLPDAGWYDETGANVIGGPSGCYWSSSICVDYPSWAWYFISAELNVIINNTARYKGFSVRPVCSN